MQLLMASLLLTGSLFGPASAAAQDATRIGLELNRLEPVAGSCRVYLRVSNPRGSALTSLKVDLFAIDADGVAQRRVAVEVGPVPSRKTMIKLFDFAELACPRFGQILLNDVIACEPSIGSTAECLGRIETSSRVPAVTFAQ